MASTTRFRVALQWAALLGAVLLLNASLTFRNIWPTPAVWWSGDLSIELAMAVLALALAAAWRGRGAIGRGAVRACAAVWTILVIGRYVDVTGPALYGREINLYWDLRFVPDVAAMFLRADPVLVGILAAIGLVLAGLYLGACWALARIARGASADPERRVLVTASLVVLAMSAVHAVKPEWPGPGFARPVAGSYARQGQFAITAMTARKSLPSAPAFDSDLSAVAGADVLLTFMESYGAITFDRPEFAAGLRESRAALEREIRNAGQQVVSAYVESPTFGGSSWFAHLSLLSGVEVRDPDTNALLMAQKRDTLVTAFRRHGYRTVAVMPGLWQLWPEGGFYGFDDIYGGERLGYRGPEFGWWAIPDQFTFARLRDLELRDGERPPAFVFFPTVSTHTPFTPTPPYQREWARMLSADPYDAADVEYAFNAQPDWTNLSPGYVQAVRYGYASIAGFLHEHAGRDFVMVLLGDHQPPALVTGEGASWNVPVHVIASRRAVLDRLVAHGFREGLTPQAPAIGRMHALMPVLLDAFGNGQNLVLPAKTLQLTE